MKTDRLIEIVTVLQQEGKVTAPYLAEKLGVSRRTINRDIEDICRAGIPVVTAQGVGGGIYVREGFRLDKSVFTGEKTQSVPAGLSSAGNAPESPSAGITAVRSGKAVPVDEGIVIGFSSHCKDSLSDKTGLLKKAIKENIRVRFTYYHSRGEETKSIEPALIISERSGWYVCGFDPGKNDFCLYKMNRIWDLSLTGEVFAPREIPDGFDPWEAPADEIIITALYDKSEKCRLVEEYGPSCFVEMAGGKLFSKLGFPSCESALQWFLSFGDKVKIIAPEEFQKRFIVETGKILVRYK